MYRKANWKSKTCLHCQKQQKIYQMYTLTLIIYIVLGISNQRSVCDLLLYCFWFFLVVFWVFFFWFFFVFFLFFFFVSEIPFYFCLKFVNGLYIIKEN